MISSHTCADPLKRDRVLYSFLRCVPISNGVDERRRESLDGLEDSDVGPLKIVNCLAKSSINSPYSKLMTHKGRTLERCFSDAALGPTVVTVVVGNCEESRRRKLVNYGLRHGARPGFGSDSGPSLFSCDSSCV